VEEVKGSSEAGSRVMYQLLSHSRKKAKLSPSCAWWTRPISLCCCRRRGRHKLVGGDAADGLLGVQDHVMSSDKLKHPVMLQAHGFPRLCGHPGIIGQTQRVNAIVYRRHARGNGVINISEEVVNLAFHQKLEML
jgi:hypothetical protein